MIGGFRPGFRVERVSRSGYSIVINALLKNTLNIAQVTERVNNIWWVERCGLLGQIKNSDKIFESFYSSNVVGSFQGIVRV
jgi:hypothetical protein